MKKLNTRGFILIGMLSAVSYVLMLLNFPIPPFPSFLMVDFSDVPALIAAITLGPLAGILVELMKNVLDYVMTGSDTGVPIGHFANFMAGISFILPVYYIYNRIQSKRGMVTGLVAGTMIMSILMSVLNYFIILPAYKYFMNFELPTTIIVTGILPFNILKGILIAIVFVLLFTRMQVWLNKQFAFKRA
ncbi:ECF transporter S component [Rossellomorea vietnamensis]|uniref:Riboflavin transporter n=2 Tax=Rossellomorea TaxID=2837508 RepID=A0A5D4KGM1_9BACI|nr:MULTISPECIES: ECF transporter S component [Rossellomorea]TYR76417.1 ECF transporter S component [Rossellomorea vietnamensis]TYS18980.1 ECF transporter S component [Rossellomorea vietnamensis]TYS76353.1 ECF transporter S component [Rossellomorea aquimaris]